MYTNISILGVVQALETFIRDEVERELIINLVNLILDSSFFQHQHRVFKQIRGLTMGAACSPTLANLVGALYEFSGPTLQVRNDPNVLWYHQYLDDISIGVMASSKVEAEARIHDVTLGPGLKLTWDNKEEGEGPSPFLDLDIYVLPESARVDFKLFRKPMNHFLRVSWDSAHPYALKRAGFLGELTRMATCSSTCENYQAATTEHTKILLVRGYPPGVLHSWVHTEMNKRWATCLSTTAASDPPTVLKSRYNPAWEHVKISTIHQAIVDSIANQHLSANEMEWCTRFSQRRMLVAFERARSLGDDLYSFAAHSVSQHPQTLQRLQEQLDRAYAGIPAAEFDEVPDGTEFSGWG